MCWTVFGEVCWEANNHENLHSGSLAGIYCFSDMLAVSDDANT